MDGVAILWTALSFFAFFAVFALAMSLIRFNGNVNKGLATDNTHDDAHGVAATRSQSPQPRS